MSFSLRQLLFATAVAATGLACLTIADSRIVPPLFDAFTMMTIVIVGYGVWVSDGELRAFRLGFLAWSGAYFVLSKLRVVSIFTTKLLAYFYLNYQPERFKLLSFPAQSDAESAWREGFFLIGHGLFALLFGVVGGWMTVYFYRQRLRMLAGET